tara:strand:+ start:6344 stop:6661 length:318 start_codon:yes stop_codon:yes gene_type:complete
MNQKKGLTIYHTTLRNIGVFFTLHLGVITMSYNKVINNTTINSILNIVGIVFLTISFLLSNELEEHRKDPNINVGKNLSNVSIIIHYTIIFMIVKMLYGLFIMNI